MRQEVDNTLLLPMVPLRGVVVFPNTVMHLDIGRKRSMNAVDIAMKEGQKIFLSAQKDLGEENPGLEEIYVIGVIAEIKQILKMPGGTIRILVEGEARARIVEYEDGTDNLWVKVEELEEWPEPQNAEMEALRRNLVSQFEQYARLGKKIPPETLAGIVQLEESGRMADVIASHMSLKVEDKQSVLSIMDIPDRVRRLSEILAQEMQVLELERKINIKVRKQMEKTQKEYYLREQMRVIQQELGDSDEQEIDEYRQKIEAAHLPEEAREKALKELERMEKMPPQTAEITVIRNYLDWMLDLPWSHETRDRLDLKAAEKILNDDHYGLEKPKERILEYLAIRKLAKKMKGPILCLVGPPGTGKTSLGKSVANALGRKFVRMSLGGVRDEAEIRGHRRTYVGSMPGRILERMKQAGARNPVFLLDEIDKMASDFRGDPASAMLEVLDPEQNEKFSDHYLEIPFDLSRVLFITTANTLETIPAPLRDRMEIIEVSSYTEEEKVQIAFRHLIPRELKEHGLKEKQLHFSEGAVRKIIECYTRESGVRSLERCIASICRKITRIVVDDPSFSVTITAVTVGKYLGIERYHYEDAEKESLVGVATGLAWTSVGGEILSIEVALVPGKGGLVLTGKLGDVMKESAQAALTYVKSRADVLGIEMKRFAETDVHVHVPEGAIPKDGPSAGITMTTALTSAFTNRRVRSDVAMTGEITLRGRVLPIGGLKEKTLAAHRTGIYTIIIPKDNRKDLEDIPLNIRRKIQFYPVDNMDQVLEIALEKE